MTVSCRIYLRPIERPLDDNTINLEYDYNESLASVEIDEQTNALVGALAAAMLDFAEIDRVVWSTWIPDSSPYDPDFVRTIPVGLPGLRTFTLTTPVDDDLSILIRKITATGRNGNIHLPFCTTVGNVLAEAGSWTFNPLDVSDFETIVTTLETALSAILPCALIGVSLLSITYPATPEGVKQVPIRTYQTSPTVRLVSGLQLVAPTERQRRQ